MEHPPYSSIDRGTLLVATPDIDVGLFFRSVILICEHNPGGAFGLVVNKSLDFEIPEEIIDLRRIVNPNVSMRAGGPVQTNQMMLLHTSEEIPSQTLEVCPGVHLGGDLDFLNECVIDKEGPSIHLCFGYSGWGAGQLEREFLDGHWFIHPASKELLFETHVDSLWKTVLRSKGGKHASLSMIPEDLTLN
jgi:putative transcriptional regulator